MRKRNQSKSLATLFWRVWCDDKIFRVCSFELLRIDWFSFLPQSKSILFFFSHTAFVNSANNKIRRYTKSEVISMELCVCLDVACILNETDFIGTDSLSQNAMMYCMYVEICNSFSYYIMQNNPKHSDIIILSNSSYGYNNNNNKNGFIFMWFASIASSLTINLLKHRQVVQWIFIVMMERVIYMPIMCYALHIEPPRHQIHGNNIDNNRFDWHRFDSLPPP